ncbi:unnamed protein product [Victoria cruziana]
MKSQLSATTATPGIVALLLLLLQFLVLSSCAEPAVSSRVQAAVAYQHHHHRHHHLHRHQHRVGELPHPLVHEPPSPRYLQLPRTQAFPPPPPPVEELDPRYGVEKRLVPTGPNPLHN